jgi:glucose-1-phosphate adenylyltransferase
MQLMQDVVTVILGGGRGTRLFPLTRTRSEPAVPIAGKYRLIDIPVSNCINSGLHKIYIVTQYLSVSLHRHVANTFDFDQFTQGFVEILPAQQTNEASRWYSGTADAIRQNLLYLDREDPRDVLILSAPIARAGPRSPSGWYPSPGSRPDALAWPAWPTICTSWN